MRQRLSAHRQCRLLPLRLASFQRNNPRQQQFPAGPCPGYYDVPALAPQGLKAARVYAAIAPEVPHAQHMPSHIFTRLGLWQESIDSNIASAAAAQRNNGSSTSRPSSYHHVISLLANVTFHRSSLQNRAACALLARYHSPFRDNLSAKLAHSVVRFLANVDT